MKRNREKDEGKVGGGYSPAMTFMERRSIEMKRTQKEAMASWIPLSERIEIEKTKLKTKMKMNKRRMKEILSSVSNKNSDEDDKVTSIYLSLSITKSCQNWYAIDLLNPDDDSSIKIRKNRITPSERTLKFSSPIYTLPTLGQLNVATVAVGSKIYVFGGYNEAPILPKIAPDLGIKDCSVYDIVTAQKTKLPDMLAKRVQPKAVYCDGRIFVFGCKRTPTGALKPWGEAFHIEANTWSPVPAPLPDCYRFPVGKPLDLTKFVQTVVCSCVVLQNPTRILAYTTHSVNKLLCFNLQDWEWSNFPDITILDNNVRCDNNFPSMVLVQNVLYIFFGFDLYFFDFDNPDGNGLLQRVIGCLPDVPRPFPYRQTNHPMYSFYLGDGSFCLLWCPMHSYSTPTSDMLHCFKFRIDLDFDYEYDPYRYATFIGCDRFAFKGADGSLHNYCAIQRY